MVQHLRALERVASARVTEKPDRAEVEGAVRTMILKKTFEEIEGYDEMIVLRGVRFESHCEHHMAPIIGRAWVAYIPQGRVVGISKLARVVDIYAKRLQIQEKMTAQIANTINDVLQPQGVGVIIKASHHCMTTRGVYKPDTDLVTSRMLGAFRDNALTRQELLGLAKHGPLSARVFFGPTVPDGKVTSTLLAHGLCATLR